MYKSSLYTFLRKNVKLSFLKNDLHKKVKHGCETLLHDRNACCIPVLTY